MSLIIAVALCYWWFAPYAFFVPTPCEASSDARKLILRKLKPEQARTLRTPAMDASGKVVSCPSTFIYTSNGEDIEVSFLVDVIHGLKFSSSDNGQTAALLSGH
jgi:hypothetical protein